MCGDDAQHWCEGLVNALASPLGDPEIRAALLDRLHQRHAAESDVAIVEELGLCRGQVFVDVTVVNGALHGYEIKSDRDSLRRLAGQVAIYSRVLDRATLVVGSRHVGEAIDFVPAWWQILVADTTRYGLRFRQRRRGRANPARDRRALVELLWHNDAVELLAACDALRSYRRRRRSEIWDRICELYGIDEIADVVRAKLRARSVQRSLPRSA
jgi:hypothetical protein